MVTARSGLVSVFVDTSLDTHLAIAVSPHDTVASVKRKFVSEHGLRFPHVGQINIEALITRWRGKEYHLLETMSISVVLQMEGGCFLKALLANQLRYHTDTDKQQNSRHDSESPEIPVCEACLEKEKDIIGKNSRHDSESPELIKHKPQVEDRNQVSLSHKEKAEKQASINASSLNPATPSEAMDQDQPPIIVHYEKYREETIKSNMERMQQLGLLNLSRHLNTAFHQTPNKSKMSTDESKKKNKKVHLITPPLPYRRSSRLENLSPVNYTEAHGKKSHEKCDVDPQKKKKKPSKEKCDVAVIEELDGREELYTEEHEKLLGSCEVPWTQFVDGYDKNSNCIYDPLKDKTCHQCRQKTMGYHTSCCKCQLVKGQLCGGCLYMRYGENVLEAIKKPDWICPVCRGICNCSLCRLKKGWEPAEVRYKKVVKLGYKSVAHYLIQTRQKPSNSNSDSEIKDAMSDITQAAKEKEPELIISDEKLGDESSGINDGETMGKHRHQLKRERKGHAGNLFFSGSIATRLRRRLY